MTEEEIISAEVVEVWNEADNRRGKKQLWQDKIVLAIGLSVIFLSSTLLYFFFSINHIKLINPLT